MKTKGQYRGHCQACGSIQVAESSGMIAKHGYKVAGFHFFAGVCNGAGHLPLQLERSLTDRIIWKMRAAAKAHEDRAADLRSGAFVPPQAQKLEPWGARIWQWSGTGSYREREPVMTSWAAAHADERKMQIELEAGESESQARYLRGHVKMLGELADRIHATPMIDRDAEELARVAAHKAKREPIEGAYRSMAEQKRDLESLNRQFYKLRESMIAHSHGGRSDFYMDMPYDLHHMNQKRVSMLIDKYPAAKDKILQAAGLYAARELVKSRPIIK